MGTIGEIYFTNLYFNIIIYGYLTLYILHIFVYYMYFMYFCIFHVVNMYR